MNSPRRQLGVSLLEIFITLTAAMVAVAVVASIYGQSRVDAMATESTQKMLVLFSEMDRAYPNGVYQTASNADILPNFAPGHMLLRYGRLAIRQDESITIVAGPMNNGIVDTAEISVQFRSTSTCVGILIATKGLPFDVLRDSILYVDSGTLIATDAMADACDVGQGTLQIIVRAADRA